MSEPTTRSSDDPVHTFARDLLRVEVHPSGKSAADAAARVVARALCDAVADRGVARAVFAAAPSQTDTLVALKRLDVPWSRVDAFHMDEYVGLPADHPARFGRWLGRVLFDAVPLREVHLINPEPDPLAECDRYAQLLGAAPIDVVVAGVGENGHLAFNDPPVADFDDPRAVKVVDLELASRQQQVHDGQFQRLEDVPRQALTLTLPALLRASTVVCVVPGARKRTAVAATLTGSIGPACPASSLRTHANATLFLDPDAAGGASPGLVRFD